MTFVSRSGPHVDAWHPWPMSHISAIYGTDSDSEILNSLYTIANVRILLYGIWSRN